VDQIGRDVFSRTLAGARVSLTVAFVGTGLSVMFGVTLGMIAGYFRGWTDTLISRSVDILLEAALSFLGVGVQPPQASWGKMLADATQIFNTAWWYMLAPGCALLFTVLAFNLVGDGMQDALNPKGTKSR
jgi:ABC-type dipeptide/oligopeptide/nickel transport system permease subunit